MNTPKATLTPETSLLFHIAARGHTLAKIFGIEITDHGDCGGEFTFKFLPVSRPWLTPHPLHTDQHSFDADIFARQLGTGCSNGQRHMILFILNVWNPGYAERQGWTFDLFAAMRTLDSGNAAAIAWWMQNPVWP